MFCFQIYVILVFNGYFNRRFYQKLMTQTNQNWQQTWKTYKLFFNSEFQASWLKIVASSVQFMVYDKFWPLFLTEITVKSTNHAHIRDQQVKIYKNPCFVFDFTSLDFLTVFPTVIFTGSWWRRKLKCNPKPSYAFCYSNYKFQENRIKTVAVTVPSCPHTKWPPWRHQIC